MVESPLIDPNSTSREARSNKEEHDSSTIVRLILAFLILVVAGGVILNIQVHEYYTTRSTKSLGHNLRMKSLQNTVVQSEAFIYPAREAALAGAKVLSSSLTVLGDTESDGLFEPPIMALTWGLASSLRSPHMFGVASYSSGTFLGYYGEGFHHPNGVGGEEWIRRGGPRFNVLSKIAYENGTGADVTVGQLNTTLGTWGPGDVTITRPARYNGTAPAYHARAREMPLGKSVVEFSVVPWDPTIATLTYAAPVRPLGGDTAAVVLSRVTNSQLTTFLSSLDLLGGTVFITTQDGHLVASSDGGDIVSTDPSTGISTLLKAWDSGDARISSSSQALLKQIDSWGELVNNSSIDLPTDIMIDGERYFLDASSLPLGAEDQSLVVVLVTPRSSILGGAEAAGRAHLVIIGVISGVSLLVWGILTIIVSHRIVDVRELQKRNEMYLEAKREAELTSRFLASTSHEIRTPMAGIIGLLEFTLEDPALTTPQQETFTTMRECAESLLLLLNDVLDVEKLAAGKLELEHEVFDARSCVEQCVALFAAKCNAKGVELGVDYGVGVARKLMGDSGRLRQVVTNLLSNAVKFTDEGFVGVRVWTEQATEGAGGGGVEIPPDGTGELWCLEVEDTGPGISEDKFEMIFEAFTQEKASTSRVYGGTGLGLNIVRMIVGCMGGQVKVVCKDPSPELDGTTGSRFRVYVPIRVNAGRDGGSVAVGLAAGAAVTPVWGQDTLPQPHVVMSGVQAVGVVCNRPFTSSVLPRAVGQQCDASCHMLESLWALVEPGVRGRFSVRRVGGDADGGATVLFLLDYSSCVKGVEETELVDWIDHFSRTMFGGFGEEQEGGGGIVGAGRVLLVVMGCPKRQLPKRWFQYGAELRRRLSIIAVGAMGLVVPSLVFRCVRREVREFCACVDCYLESASCTGSDGGRDEDEDDGSGPGELGLELRAEGGATLSQKKRMTCSGGVVEEKSSVWDGVCGGGSMEQDLAVEQKPGLGGRGDEPQLDAAAAVADPSLVSGNSSSRKRFRVLVAEDNQVNQKVIMRMLEKVGAGLMARQGISLETLIVDNGEKAVGAFVEATRKSPGPGGTRGEGGGWDLILMDCGMPVCGGLEATQRIRQVEAQGLEQELAQGAQEGEEGEQKHIGIVRVPIVALTADVMPEQREKCLQAGMDGHLAKPVRTGQIEDLITCVLEGRRRISGVTRYSTLGQEPLPPVDE